ncbi:MAG: HAMP domain-containing histidine kinase [Cloacibacterium normanense]|nr:HAMP domain-containing histidine kinase [Cloacibacterium normanense]HCO21024.1 two-component sensor histidine kinase [Flavobacteriaceae bacterium]
MALHSYSLRTKIFIGFMVVCFFSIIGSTAMSYLIIKKSTDEQSVTEMQNKFEALMKTLDYAVSHTNITQDKDLVNILQNEIYEISDINKHDVILYDLQGNYLVSNKELNLVAQKKIPHETLMNVLESDKRVDVQEYDQKVGSNVTSSYMILRNNMLEPIAIVYFPFYHNDNIYAGAFNKYVQYIILVNLFLILLSIWLSWVISKNLTKTITRISELITRTTLFGREMKPIKYFQNDELSGLVKSYNKMIYQIEDQKMLLANKEREEAWREMAKQVAHEVKNPLTPMKLLIQNFERKFDKNDPEIDQKVRNLSRSLVDQIDLVATVASAFSEFAKLPPKNDEFFNLKEELENLVRVFNDDGNIYFHANKDMMPVRMDRIYLSRIFTNLITNAKQAVSEQRKSIINIDVELFNKKIIIVIEDNGIGIPKDKLEQIFEPNFTTKNSGMGLGLTMVKKMIEEYKGDISVKSEEGKGTKFTIILPTNV